MPTLYPPLDHTRKVEYPPRAETMYSRRPGQAVDIHSFPPELLMQVFEELDLSSMRSCLLTCRQWHRVGERVMYASPRLSSAAAMKCFISVLARKMHLRGAAKRLHLRGKANYSSSQRTHWILDAPRCLAPLLPNVKSLTFENVENVPFSRPQTEHTFWRDLECFVGVTELNIIQCRFEFVQDLRNFVFSFPSLNALTLSHVKWAYQQSMDPELNVHNHPRWQRILPLRTLRLAYFSTVPQYQAVLPWLENLHTVCTLEVEHIPAMALGLLANYLTRLADSGNSLQSLAFSPLIMEHKDTEFLPCLAQALRMHKRLGSLNLHIVSLQAMRWVPMVFDAARDLPISRVTLEFTLDIENAARPSQAFIETNERLCRYWPKTLRRVTFVHHPTGSWVPDKDVPYILSSRCPSLDDRGIVDVRIGVRYA